MIKRDTLTQSIPAAVWSVTLPEGATKGRPLAAYDTNGNSLEWDSWQFETGIISVNFGIDPVVGELEYEYQMVDDSTTTITGDGGVVNVTVHQYNGVPQSQL